LVELDLLSIVASNPHMTAHFPPETQHLATNELTSSQSPLHNKIGIHSRLTLMNEKKKMIDSWSPNGEKKKFELISFL
jgi:tyrosine-protein phosphatase YwqE